MQQGLEQDAAWLDLSRCANRSPWRARSITANPTEPLPQIAARWFGCAAENVLPIASKASFYDLISNHNISLKEVHSVAKISDWIAREERFVDLSTTGDWTDNTISLRDCATFWGIKDLAFVVARSELLARIAPFLSTPTDEAVTTGAIALNDCSWAGDMITYLAEACLRLDLLASRRGWQPVGGTHLYRLYHADNATDEERRLKALKIRIARVPAMPALLRLAIPRRDEWDRIAIALERH